MRYVGLVDCNNFFVSCERLFRPDLKNRPVVVLSSNDGCVVARSQEIKDKGIAMGVPYFQIKDTLSDMGAVTFSSHFALYRDISNRVFEVLRRRLGSIEPYSIDECFFRTSLAEAEALGIELRDLVAKEVGIPVSVGIALSKTQAKYANSLAKKTNGFYLLKPEDWQVKIGEIKMGEVWGVGVGRTKQFGLSNINTVAEFLNLTAAEVGERFGIEGVRLYTELTGLNSSKIFSDSPTPKSIMNTRSFAKESKSKKVMLEALFYHLHELVKELHQTGTKASRIRVLMYPSRYSSFAFQGSSVEAILTIPSSDIFELTKVVTDLVEKHYRQDVPYKKAGVVATVRAEGALTASLFGINSANTNELTETVIAINNRHGKNALRLGNLAQSQAVWSSRSESMSPDYTTCWSDLKTVKA